MKKIAKLLIIVIIIAIIVATLLLIFKNKKTVLSSEQALEVATEKYNNLLNYAQADGMNLSGNDNNPEGYKFDNKLYLKIENYDETVKNDVYQDYMQTYSNIARIIEKDGEHYISIDSIDRKKDKTYESTQLIIKSITKDEIICDAESFYISYDEKGNKTSSKVAQEFKLKLDKKTWKVSQFELPY
ncbi:MAG: hypothetical protein J6K42_04145 [Clostridia bacterium]|nr:hypothetical protein [Clostridia bacterium]